VVTDERLGVEFVSTSGFDLSTVQGQEAYLQWKLSQPEIDTFGYTHTHALNEDGTLARYRSGCAGCDERDENHNQPREFIPPVVTYVGTERFGSILVEKEEK